MPFTELIEGVRSRKVRVAVVGDAMIDTYMYGKVSRISPEFPVPILHSPSARKENLPGGAANVCYQFKHLNADAQLFSLLDRDALEILYSDHRINVEGCIELNHGSVPRKIRYYDDDFPLLRHDVERPNYGCSSIERLREELLAKFVAAGKFDVVILSNYNKGLFDFSTAQLFIAACRASGAISVVDPKDNPDWWVGCDYFKPNAAEAAKMTGQTDWREQCVRFRNEGMYGVARKGVVVTQSGAGVVGVTEEGFFEYRPRTTVKDVSSVIGAGDCFAAVLALGITHGLTLPKAVECAFAAGTQYVKAKHNRPIALYELHRQLDPLAAKIMSVEDLTYLRDGVYSDQRWVFTNGCFDIMHPGHIASLQAAKSRGDKLVVAVNSDASVQSLKGPSRPIMPLSERVQMVAALECVDFVVSFEEDVPYKVVEAVRPNVMVKGKDYADKPISGAELAGEVFLVDMLPGSSTTNIIRKIKELG